MDAKNQNLLDSIFEHTAEKKSIQHFSNRADHAINSIINLLEDIEIEFSTEDAEDLKKRLFLSIKNRDYNKFQRGLENISIKKDK